MIFFFIHYSLHKLKRTPLCTVLKKDLESNRKAALFLNSTKPFLNCPVQHVHLVSFRTGKAPTGNTAQIVILSTLEVHLRSDL